MGIRPLGDQARSFALQLATNKLRVTLQTLTQEQASGEVADIGARVGGNTQILNNLETQLRMGEQYQRNTAEAGSIAGIMVDVLADVQESASKIGVVLVTQDEATARSTIKIGAIQAEQALTAAMAHLNSQIGGQHIFGGTITDRPPLIAAGAMLDQLRSLTSGLTTADAIGTAIATWFDAPPGQGGFLDIAYSGAVAKYKTVEIGQGQEVALDVTAATPAIRETLKGLAMVAISARDMSGIDEMQQVALMRAGGQIMFRNDTAILGEIGRMGLGQETLALTKVRQDATQSTLEIARNTIRQADPYATVVALKETEAQLEALYNVTGRLQKLSLLDYLR